MTLGSDDVDDDVGSGSSPVKRNPALSALDNVANSLARMASPEPVRLNQLDRRLEQYGVLNELESSTGIRKSHWLVLAAIFAMAFILFGFGANALCEWIGFIYPVYASFKCLEDDSINREAVSAWLIYWIVFGVSHTYEFVADSILSRFPFYYPLKVVFVLWCLLPHYRGAAIIYSMWLQPALCWLQPRIDIAQSDLTHVARNSVNAVCVHLRASFSASMRRYPAVSKLLKTVS
uniref:Receptor expression-enhancing protein n=1 Tax=Spongospora subterranea TaxID=70186 RepID=A0A0H5R4E0_9EUKA|eukprot:CRZ09075.1 hypothetical protein [Spongospora subterranea]